MNALVSPFAQVPRVIATFGITAFSSVLFGEKKTIAILFLAFSWATGVMVAESSGGIVTANLNQTATNGNPVYFSYDAGAIGTLDWGSSGNLSIRGNVNYDSEISHYYLSVDSIAPTGPVDNSSPLLFGTAIGASVDWIGAVNSISSDGYFGVRFSAGGSDYNYGWVAVTITSSTITFGLASVETTVNTPIAAGAVASAVPEIDPATGGSALSLVAGVLAMIEQRRRRGFLATRFA